jgi:hypothetical protein
MPPTMPLDDGNGWSTEGRNILSAERMSAIRKVLEEKGPIIIEHWFYYGSRAPDRFVFEDYDQFVEYLAWVRLRWGKILSIRRNCRGGWRGGGKGPDAAAAGLVCCDSGFGSEDYAGALGDCRRSMRWI